MLLLLMSGDKKRRTFTNYYYIFYYYYYCNLWHTHTFSEEWWMVVLKWVARKGRDRGLWMVIVEVEEKDSTKYIDDEKWWESVHVEGKGTRAAAEPVPVEAAAPANDFWVLALAGYAPHSLRSVQLSSISAAVPKCWWWFLILIHSWLEYSSKFNALSSSPPTPPSSLL